MIKPHPLSIGDTIGIVAPASPPKDPKEIGRGVEALEELGFKVQFGKNARKRMGYLAGSDAERASDINRMFGDSSVQGIMCLRGGYGTPRILDLLDYQVIKKNPKVFCGFSDITALHSAIQVKTGLCTFHGPTLLSGFGKEEPSAYTTTCFLKSVCDPQWNGDIARGFPRKKYPALKSIHKGKSTGRLVGGNLALLSALIGTSYFPELRNSILFLEDVNESPYKVDRALTQLLQTGLLKNVRGIALGVWSGCEAIDAAYKKKGISLLDVFTDRLRPLGIPVVYGLPFGHITDYCTLPYGVKAELNGNSCSLTVLESPLRTLGKR